MEGVHKLRSSVRNECVQLRKACKPISALLIRQGLDSFTPWVVLDACCSRCSGRVGACALPELLRSWWVRAGKPELGALLVRVDGVVSLVLDEAAGGPTKGADGDAVISHSV